MGEAADRCFKTHYQVEAVARKLIAYLEVL
jgi:hypothetical protein